MDLDVGRVNTLINGKRGSVRVETSNGPRSIYWESMEAANILEYQCGDDVCGGSRIGSNHLPRQ